MKRCITQRNCKIICVIPDDGKREYGNTVYTQDDLGNRFLYAHLKEIIVELNQKVRAGGLIGIMGNTGNSSGPHLHYGMYLPGDSLSDLRGPNAIDPSDYLKENGYPVENGVISNPYGRVFSIEELGIKNRKHMGVDFV